MSEIRCTAFHPNYGARQAGRCRCFALGLALACAVSAAGMGCAQSAPATPAAGSDQTKPAAQQVQGVTTTVVVHGEVKDDYLPESVSVGTLDGTLLKEMPLSATVVTRDLLNDQGARLLSDVVKNDASIGNDYVPVGYYGVYQIRGFAIDLASGLEINGMTIAGEQDVPLENKERVELLKGIAGVESGVASAGGLINFVTKRPAAIKALDVATDHRGSAYGAVDLGALFGRQKQVGLRANVGGERIASYVNDTNGWRAVGAGAADWKLTPKAMLKGDFEYQHKVERDASGYQLLGGTVVPDINAALSVDDAGRSAVGTTGHVRHLQHQRALRLQAAARVAGVCSGESEPLADRRQRDLCVWDAVRCQRQCRLPQCAERPGVLLLPGRQLRNLRLPRSGRAAHRRRGRGAGDRAREDGGD
jgi:outer membrane receptor protein involved in Fe transport